MEAKREPTPSPVLERLKLAANVGLGLAGMQPLFQRADAGRSLVLDRTPSELGRVEVRPPVRPAYFAIRRRGFDALEVLDDGSVLRGSSGTREGALLGSDEVSALADEFVAAGFFALPDAARALADCDLIVEARAGAEQHRAGVGAGDSVELRARLERLANRVEAKACEPA
jgi:hypothetical protein